MEEWHADVVRRRAEVTPYFARMEPALLSTKLSDLERVNIRHSLRRYAEQRGPVGANRLLSILKTALRFAYRDEPQAGWRNMYPRITEDIEGPRTR